jgi:hypothetical protein
MVVHCFDAVQMKVMLVGTPHHQRVKSPYLSYTLTIILVRVEFPCACKSHVVVKFATVERQLSNEKAANNKPIRIAGWMAGFLYREYE